MYILPLPFLLGTLATLASLALLAGGIYIVWAWIAGTLVATSWLVSGIGMLAWSLLGRQIVLAHGWALDSTAWYYVRKELAKSHRLVMRDLPGLGRSTQPADGRYSVERLAEDLRSVINRLTSLSHGVTRGQLEFATRFNVKDKPNVIAKGLRAVLRWTEARTPPALALPVRVIAGDADRLTKPEAGRALSEMAPDADFVSISPAGHNGLLEEGGQYAAAIAQFVERATEAGRQGAVARTGKA